MQVDIHYDRLAYAKEIFLCFVCDYGHYGDIRSKGTIKQNNRPSPSGCF